MGSVEMNIHVVQNDLADAELLVLMDITKKICSSQNNAPVAGLVQDAIVGLYFLSRKTTRVTISHFNDCLLSLINFPNVAEFFMRAKKYYPTEFENNKPKYDTLPGRVLVSVLFPSDFYYTCKT